MCLYVKKSFVKNPIPVVYCWKELYIYYKMYNKKIAYTPFKNAKIKEDGTLYPQRPRYPNKEFKYHSAIEGGFIHAFQKKPKQKSLNHHIQIFKAIATDVIAIGHNNDLICKALYIPDLDLTIKS